MGTGPRGRLKARREALRPPVSLAEMGRRVGVDARTVQRWETGRSDPYPRQWEAIARGYEWPLDDLESLLARDDDVADESAPDRSEMLATVVATGGRIGAGVVSAVEAITAELRRLDDQAGGGTVLPLAEAHVDLVARLLTHGSYMPGVGERLHRSYADVAQLAGWVAYDAGHHIRSARHYALSLNAAHRCSDPLLATHTLAMMAFGSRYEPDPDAQRLLDAAESLVPAGRRSDGVRAMLAAWRMFDHAQRRDRRAFERTFSDAARWFERSRPQDWPSWMYWLWHPERMADTGHALTMLGEHRRALDVLEAGEAMAADWPRDQVLYIAFQAEAHRGLGDHDAAEHHRRRAVELMGDQIISGRLATMLSVEET